VARKITIEPYAKYPETHRLVKVEVKGRVWAIAWAKPWPTPQQAEDAWITDRAAFEPYDESTGTFIRKAR
jgi:hypothetical protein